MKNSFLSGLLGSCLGVIAAFILLVLFIVISGVSGSDSKKYVKKGSVLNIKLENFVPEKTNNVSKQNNLFEESPDALGLQTIVKLIKHAGNDDKIKGISIESNDVMLGQASLLTVMEALEGFKKSGKFIYAYGDFYSQSAYTLASVADSVFIHPQGGVDLRGYGAMIPFYKNMLDKLGVEFNVFYAGDFKSASEPYRLNKMSEPNRLQTKEFLTDMKNIMFQKIAQYRKIQTDKLHDIVNKYDGRDAEKALQNRLVDKILYKVEYQNALAKKLGLDVKKLKSISLSDYNDSGVKFSEHDGNDEIAVVYLEGEVAYGVNDYGVISEKKYEKIFKKIKDNDKAKAVVLRINSPGGSAFTSDVLWHQIEEIKKTGKKVVASFGDYAASGGYYIAANSDKIVAQPNTLTGSIGVFMMFPNASKLLNDKIGLNFDTIKTHPFASGFSMVQPLSEQEKVILQESTLKIYDTFIDRVSKGRNLSLDSTKVIARGRVWTGRRAKDIGLVDELGDMEKAINLAAKLAKSNSYHIVEYPSIKEDFFSSMVKEFNRSRGGDDAMALITSPKEKAAMKQLLEWKSMVKYREPQARLPFLFEW
jgi:protease-4